MNHPTMFSSGLELGNLVVGSGLLDHSWAKIVDLSTENDSNTPILDLCVKHKVYQHTEIGTVIVFVSSPPCTTQQHLLGEDRDLVPSEILKEKLPVFEFIGTKSNPSFSINKAAVTLFTSLQNELSLLKDQYVDISPLIITGHSIGGSVASLFTLWLLDNIALNANGLPLCITFGSPLIGNDGFQRAISERSTWNSCFLHVASAQDPIPKLFALPHNIVLQLSSNARIYKPFGTFLLCSESGCAFFEEPESVLELMVADSMDGNGNFGTNEGLQIIDYDPILKKLRLRALFRDISELGEWNFSPLQTGIVIQIKAIKDGRTQVNGDVYPVIKEIEKRMKSSLARTRSVLDTKKKLNDMKINMTYLEWYKKVSVSNGGYYDTFKNIESRRREEIVKRKSILTQYWNKKVQQEERKPKKGGAFYGLAWLYGGTNYRRMVEPLDIAEWYKKGKKDYLANRSEHYKLLELWVKNYQNNANDRNRACSLTEDSCFWAHVEEAIISCKFLGDVGGACLGEKETLVENLVRFENYVMGLITNYAVSTEIFFKQSSFMQWWENYERIRGSSYHSSFTDFMRNRKHEHYV